MAHADILPGVPLIESPFFDELFVDGEYSPEVLRIARDLHDRGFAVIQFPEPDFDRFAESIKSALRPRFNWTAWFDSGESQRIQDAWTFDDNVRRIATNQNVLDLLTTLFGRKAFPFQSLNFPFGTQQHLHTDIVHFSSVPEHFMCGVWVALEDVDASAGPLIYVPGSHTWRVFANEHIGVDTRGTVATQEIYEPLWRELLRKSGIVPEVFTPQKGQALIWLSNLLHGGAKHIDRTKTRWSQVTHYYFENCAYFTPMLSNPVCGDFFFRSLVDVKTGQSVENQYLGRKIPPAFIDFTRSRSGISPADLDGVSPPAASAAQHTAVTPAAAAPEHVLPTPEVERETPTQPRLGKEVNSLKELLALDGHDFVISAYRAILDRPPDEKGLENYVAELESGVAKFTIVSRLRNSVEGRRLGRSLPGYRAETVRRHWRSLTRRLHV